MKFKKFILTTTLAVALMSTGCSTNSSQAPVSNATEEDTPSKTQTEVVEDPKAT